MIFSVGCGNKYPDDPLKFFEPSEEISGQVVVLDGALHGVPGWSVEYDHPIMVVVETRYLNDKKFFVIDLEQKTVKKVVNHGRGDCEFNNVFLNSLDHKAGYFTFFDNDKKANYKVLLDSISSHDNTYTYCPEKIILQGENQNPTRFFDLRAIDERYTLGYLNETSDSMYTVFDLKDGTSYDKYAFPRLKGLSKKEMEVGRRLFWGYTHVSPDKEKIALIAQPTLVELMGWKDGQLTRKKRIEFFRYRFNLDYEGNRISRRGFHNKEGFLLGDVTDNFVYVGYCGYTEEEMAKMGVYPSAFYVLVFDWEGNPVKSYSLDRTIIALVAKEDDSGMYGISIGAESIDVVEYDFNH